VARNVADALNTRKKPLNGSKVLLVGLAYKPDVDDMRESPALALMDLLEKRGAEVSYYDPHIPWIGPTREHGHRMGMKSIEWKRETISKFDLVLISTAHSGVNYHELAEWSSCVVDTRNAMAGIPVEKGKVWKA